MIPSPNDQLTSTSSLSTSSQANHPANSESSQVKYACASCIRGHRTSSCTHKDGSKGPLYPIRSKGRPPTQCEVCRQKRKESGRHVRCDCNGKKTSRSSSPPKKPATTATLAPILPDSAVSHEADDHSDDARPTKKSRIQVYPHSSGERRWSSGYTSPDEAHSGPFDNTLAPIRSVRSQHSWSLPSIHSTEEMGYRSDHDKRRTSEEEEGEAPRRHSTLSLSNLMNPCRCRSSGPCSCCSDQRRGGAPTSPKQSDNSSQTCASSNCNCSDASCQKDQLSAIEKEPAPPSKPATSSCCSGKRPSASAAPSIDLLLQAVDMSTEFVPPPCGCGDSCRCARCLSKPSGSSSIHKPAQSEEAHATSSSFTASSASPRTPPAVAAGCDDCAACDLALERPSGIGAVDSWMEKQRHSPRTRTSSPSTESKLGNRNSNAHVASVPTLHGGLLSESDKAPADEGEEQVRAELVLVHPNCAACLEVVRKKGVGVLSSAIRRD